MYLLFHNEGTLDFKSHFELWNTLPTEGTFFYVLVYIYTQNALVNVQIYKKYPSFLLLILLRIYHISSYKKFKNPQML